VAAPATTGYSLSAELVIRPKIVLPRGGRRAGGIDIIGTYIDTECTARVVGIIIIVIAYSDP
jgi:hypothetical protein